jgi:hypothetical protein
MIEATTLPFSSMWTRAHNCECTLVILKVVDTPKLASNANRSCASVFGDWCHC